MAMPVGLFAFMIGARLRMGAWTEIARALGV